jgi:PAS domain S-box-containing protein
LMRYRNQKLSKNTSRIMSFVIFFVALLQGIFTFIPGQAFAGEKKNVLVLNSYHQGYAWSDNIMKGISSVMGPRSMEIELSFEYMDTKRNNDPLYIELLYDIYRMKYKDRNFDLLIPMDESAFEFILKYQNEIFPHTPVVFCGVHGFSDSMIRGRENLITGVLEEHDIKATLDIALKLKPGTKKVFVIHDKTKMALSMRSQLDNVIGANDYSQEFFFWSDMSMSEIREKVRFLPADSIILYLIFLKDKNGEFFTPQDSIFKISSGSTVPVFGLGDFFLGHGIVGGMLNNGFYQGKTAADLAMEILDGKFVSDVPIVRKSPNRYMFDYFQLKRFNINIVRLPYGSEIINKPTSFYKENERLVQATITVIALLSIIIIILLYNVRRRWKSERKLREEHELISQIISNIPHAIFWKDAETIYLGCNENFANTLGIESPGDIVGKTDYDLSWSKKESDYMRERDLDIITTGNPILNLEVSPTLPDGQQPILLVSKVPLRNPSGTVIGVLGIFSDITSRKQEEEARARLATVVEQASEMIVITDIEGIVQYVNPAFERITGYSSFESVDKDIFYLTGNEENEDEHRKILESLWLGNVWEGRCSSRKKDGSVLEEEVTITPVRDSSGVMISYVTVSRDVSQELMLEMQLRQAQKLEAIGQLAAGIAHEINTPSQYVGDNTRFLKDAFGDLIGLLQNYDKLVSELKNADGLADYVKDVESIVEDIDLGYLMEEIPQAIDQSIEGIERIAKIVRAMKEFSHPGSEEKTPVDLNRAIESTITVARNEWKYVSEIVTDFDPRLPLVPCLPGEFNQVILNMIVNAAHAIADVKGENSEEKGEIRISTKHKGEWAEIRISDTGGGIPEKIRSRIFDPFFTTKEVGKGTGQGLAISHNVIVEKLGGLINLETEEGSGSTFIICLPVTNSNE